MYNANENYMKSRWYYSIGEFWSGMDRLFARLADAAYKNDNMGLYRKYNNLCWKCNRKTMKSNLKARYYCEER